MAAVARASVQEHESGATLGAPVAMPMGYVFPVSRDGQVVGTIMVSDDTGQVLWRTAASPTTSAS